MPEPSQTDEEWYALHDFRTVNWDVWRAATEQQRERRQRERERHRDQRGRHWFDRQQSQRLTSVVCVIVFTDSDRRTVYVVEPIDEAVVMFEFEII